jgi:glycerol-3-phosphate acyltransferase PlsY
MEILPLILAVGLGYLFGSIPFGLLLAKATGQGDIRQIGSGNIGATNVLRTGRKDIAALTLLLDAAKAAGAGLLLVFFFGQPYGYIAAAAALVGHCYPVWLGFKGGKGVATFFGGLFALVWPVALFAAVVWLATAFITRLSSLGALLACIGASIFAWFIAPFAAAVMVSFMAAIILLRHNENIQRLARGEESKIGQKK